MSSAIRIELRNRSTYRRLTGINVRSRADRHVHFGSRCVEDYISGPMSRTSGEVYNLLWLTLGLCLPGFVFESNDSVLIPDVEIIMPQRHPEGTVEARCEYKAFIDLPVVVRIPEYGYTVGL